MSSVSDIDPDVAATKIQRAWRSKSRPKPVLTGDSRWKDAAVHAKFKIARGAADDNDNSPKARLRRAAFFASRLQDGDSLLSGKGIENSDTKMLKTLEVQHYLELIDSKHRYGSNLKFYHRRWQEEDTQDNFFRWLDRGAGKELTLEECPREKLEGERIIYLSAEQRLNYLVQIDDQGRLRWSKDNQLVDTTAGHWKDIGDGGGIVPDMDASTSKPQDREPAIRRTSFDASPPVSPLSSSSSVASQIVEHYNEPVKGNRVTRAIRKNLTVRGALDKLLKRTIKRNTWIYVADKHYNIFIGIKHTGEFQHSSFLAGGVATSAGLISVKDGLIHTLSPLSGHYRTDISHFHHFVNVLDQRGADMSKVKISKAEAALWGIEHLAKFQKKRQEVAGAMKKKTEKAATEVAKMVKPDSGWKTDILYGHKKESADDKEQSRNGHE